MANIQLIIYRSLFLCQTMMLEVRIISKLLGGKKKPLSLSTKTSMRWLPPSSPQSSYWVLKSYISLMKDTSYGTNYGLWTKGWWIQRRETRSPSEEWKSDMTWNTRAKTLSSCYWGPKSAQILPCTFQDLVISSSWFHLFIVLPFSWFHLFIILFSLHRFMNVHIINTLQAPTRYTLTS